MTIARKLWLGFGIVILIFLVASLIIFFSERSISSALDEIANVEEPTRDASQGMEINLVEMSRNVSEYLQAGDPQYREQFAEDRADFEESKARFDELIDTPTGREQGERIDLLYGEYVALSESLMDQRDEQTGTSDDSIEVDEQGFLELQDNLDDVLDGEVQPWTGQQLAEAEEDASGAIRNVYVTTIVLPSRSCAKNSTCPSRSQITKGPELRFRAVLGADAEDVRLERAPVASQTAKEMYSIALVGIDTSASLIPEVPQTLPHR